MQAPGPSRPPWTPPCSKPICRNCQKHSLFSVIWYLELHSIKHNKADVFRDFDVTKRTGWRMLKEVEDDQKGIVKPADKRGRPRKVSKEQVRKVKEMKTGLVGKIGRRPTWKELRDEGGLDCSWHTLRRAMKRDAKEPDVLDEDGEGEDGDEDGEGLQPEGQQAV